MNPLKDLSVQNNFLLFLSYSFCSATLHFMCAFFVLNLHSRVDFFLNLHLIFTFLSLKNSSFLISLVLGEMFSFKHLKQFLEHSINFSLPPFKYSVLKILINLSWFQNIHFSQLVLNFYTCDNFLNHVNNRNENTSNFFLPPKKR